jgi:serine/threonine protein kinase
VGGPSIPSLEGQFQPLLPEDPRRLGRYDLTGRLGAGGMGVVYLGRDDDGRPVAVKVINAQLAGDPQYRARFLQEAELGRRVASFCTPDVLDVAEDGGRPYFVTEYVAGTPLNRLVGDGAPLPDSEVAALAAGVALALSAIHRAGLIHRDLKPGNVLLSRSGVRVIDFGIARPLDGNSEITQSGEVMGSLGWIAPEQLTGGKLTPAADVFAWGCLVAYAGTGRHPFGGQDAASRIYRIVTGAPDLDGLSQPLRAWVSAALAKEPVHRPTTDQILSGLTTGTPPPLRARVDSATRAFPLSTRAANLVRRRLTAARPRRFALMTGAAAVMLAAGAAAIGVSAAGQPSVGPIINLEPAAVSQLAPAAHPQPVQVDVPAQPNPGAASPRPGKGDHHDRDKGKGKDGGGHGDD